MTPRSRRVSVGDVVADLDGGGVAALMRQDSHAVFAASSAAQRATDYLFSLQPEAVRAPNDNASGRLKAGDAVMTPAP